MANATPNSDAESRTPLLDKHAVNLTSSDASQAGDLSRTHEAETIAKVLCEGKRYPILVSDHRATIMAILNRLAQLLSEGRISDLLRYNTLYFLDIKSLKASCELPGGFDRVIKDLFHEVKVLKKTIFVIKDADLLGGNAQRDGQWDDFAETMDRYEVPCIGTASQARYSENSFLHMQFRPIEIAGASQSETRTILGDIKERMERRACVPITEDALTTTVSLASKYLKAALPDSAIELLDACIETAHGSREFLQSRLETIKCEQRQAIDSVAQAEASKPDSRDHKRAKEHLAQVNQDAVITTARLLVMQLAEDCGRTHDKLTQLQERFQDAVDRGDMTEAADIKWSDVPTQQRRFDEQRRRKAFAEEEVRSSGAQLDIINADTVRQAASRLTGTSLEVLRNEAGLNSTGKPRVESESSARRSGLFAKPAPKKKNVEDPLHKGDAAEKREQAPGRDTIETHKPGKIRKAFGKLGIGRKRNSDKQVPGEDKTEPGHRDGTVNISGTSMPKVGSAIPRKPVPARVETIPSLPEGETSLQAANAICVPSEPKPSIEAQRAPRDRQVSLPPPRPRSPSPPRYNAAKSEALIRIAKRGYTELDLRRQLKGGAKGGADPNTLSPDGGNSALHLAVENNSPELIQPLLDARADINIQNDAGDTPLHVAASTGRGYICEKLLNNGANLLIVNKEGKTAKEVAIGGVLGRVQSPAEKLKRPWIGTGTQNVDDWQKPDPKYRLGAYDTPRSNGKRNF